MKSYHRLFSFLSVTWRGEPLTTYETIINLISSTQTRTGLKVKARLDRDSYETGKKVTNKEMDSLNLKPHSTHPGWNYTIRCRK